MKYYDRPFFTKFTNQKPCYDNEQEYMESIATSVKEILSSRNRLDSEMCEYYNHSTAFSYGIKEGLMYSDQEYIYKMHLNIKDLILKFEPRVTDVVLNSFSPKVSEQKVEYNLLIVTRIGQFQTNVTISMQ